MNPGLEQVRAAVAARLWRRPGSLRRATAFSPRLGQARTTSPVAAVGLRTGESRGGALGSYLGHPAGPGQPRRCREVYGMRLDLTLTLDIYAPARKRRRRVRPAPWNTLHQVVLQGLPSGLRSPRELQLGGGRVGPETTAMFLRRGSSCRASAYFAATATEDGLRGSPTLY